MIKKFFIGLGVLVMAAGSFLAVNYAIQKGANVDMKTAAIWMVMVGISSFMCIFVGDVVCFELERRDWKKGRR